MNHSEVASRPGPANTAASPFSLALPLRRTIHPSASRDAFADLFAEFSRPQPVRTRDDAADRRPESAAKVAGQDPDTAGDDETTEDAPPAPTAERLPLIPDDPDFHDQALRTSEFGKRPRVTNERSPDPAMDPNAEPQAAAATGKPAASALDEPSPAGQDVRPPGAIRADAAEGRTDGGDDAGDETLAAHAATHAGTHARKPRPGGDQDDLGGSTSETDPPAGAPTGIAFETAAVGRGQAGDPSPENPKEQGPEVPDGRARDARHDRPRRRDRREGGRPTGNEPNEREARQSQPSADQRPMSEAAMGGATTDPRAGSASQESGTNSPEPMASLGGGGGGPNAMAPVGSAMPPGGSAAASGVPGPAAGASSAAGGETAPQAARPAAPDAAATNWEGNATSRGPAAPSGPSSAAEAEGRIDAAARVRLVQRVSRAFQQLGASGGIVRMKLAPAELGSIRIEMRVQDHQVEARVVAESEAASQLLRDHLAELRQRLESQGLRVERFDVRTEADAESWSDVDWRHGDRDDHPTRGDGGQDRQRSRHDRGQPAPGGDRIETPSRGPGHSGDRPIDRAPLGGRPGIDASW